MTLTAGGQRLVGIASQMIALAAEAEDAIRQARGAPERLRVVATSTVAESVAPALVSAFTSRGGAFDVSLGVGDVRGDGRGAVRAAGRRRARAADLGRGRGRARMSVPLFRYRLALVASPAHRLAGVCCLRVRSLADEVWLVDPDGTDPASPVFQLLRRLAVPEDRVRVFPSQTAAWVAAEEGHGIAPAVTHLVSAELERRSLVTLNVEGTPLELLWYATMLAPDRRSPAAAALRRFMETPDATHAMHAPLSGVPPSRFRPPVYVTLGVDSPDQRKWACDVRFPKPRVASSLVAVGAG